ncbi:MAG: hypothetical protein KIS94_05000 [Chitinophagales bacterium]|nr:hypothetical protein [Chitinophagales bacterium]
MKKSATSFYYNLLTMAAFVLAIGGLAIYIQIVLLKYNVVLGYDLSVLSPSEAGGFVDGIIGSILSFTGVVLFYVSLQLQRKELANQREELVNQRMEFRVNNILNMLLRHEESINSFYRTAIGNLLAKNLKDEIAAFSITDGIVHSASTTVNELSPRLVSELEILFAKLLATARTIQNMTEGLDEHEVYRIKKNFYQNLDPDIYKIAEVLYHTLFEFYYLVYVTAPQSNHNNLVELFESLLAFRDNVNEHDIEIDEYIEEAYS